SDGAQRRSALVRQQEPPLLHPTDPSSSHRGSRDTRGRSRQGLPEQAFHIRQAVRRGGSMTWLTKIVPDLRYRQTRADFRTAGNLHRKLIRLSSDLGEERIANPRQRSGLLFSIEETRNELYRLVQSHSPLRVDRLGPGYHGVQMRNLDPFLARLDKGSRVRYRIVASPTKRLG